MKKRNIIYITLFVIWIILHYVYYIDCTLDTKFRIDENTALDAPFASSIAYTALDAFGAMYFFNLIIGIFLLIIITKRAPDNWIKKLHTTNTYNILFVAIAIIEIMLYVGFLLFVHNTELPIELKTITLTIIHKLGILAIIDVLLLSRLHILSNKKALMSSGQ